MLVVITALASALLDNVTTVLLIAPLTWCATGEVLTEVEWPILAFFAGLFIMIGGLIGTGVNGEISKSLAEAIGDSELGGSMLLLGASAVLSGNVDHIPHVATAPRSPQTSCTTWVVTPTTSCGGRWPSARTSAATPPPLAPASSCSASPNATAGPSASGSSPGRPRRHRRHRGPLRPLRVACALRPRLTGGGTRHAPAPATHQHHDEDQTHDRGQ
ncbi:SLC13 family permease [Streptomyces sp. NPDC088254]|uniref:SLC13 family permease n=1 Tax=Streptomyces sp. NPDC088254 TaxID=3365847 RepID=UPI0038274BC8